jgi:hypothetical protein
VQLPKLAYYGLNTQASARNVQAGVDQDERELAERRAEMVLEQYLLREMAQGWHIWVRRIRRGFIFKGGFSAQRTRA